MSENRGAPQVARTTPGPWRVDDEQRNGREYVYVVRVMPDGSRRFVAHIFACDTARVANARLIAAAPTMRDYIAKRANEGDTEALKIMEAINAGR